MICYSPPLFVESILDYSFTTKISHHEKYQKHHSASCHCPVHRHDRYGANCSSKRQFIQIKFNKNENLFNRKRHPWRGQLTPEQLKAISQKSCSILQNMGPQIQWIQSYVTGDKIFCVYKAENEDLIREHAKEGGFPANVITEISTTISPATAKQ